MRPGEKETVLLQFIQVLLQALEAAEFAFQHVRPHHAREIVNGLITDLRAIMQDDDPDDRD